MRKKQRNLFIGTIIVTMLVAYLVYGGMQDTMVYYVTVSELKSNGNETFTRGFRLSGNVKDETTQWSPETLTLKFQIVDDNQEMIDVVYHGAIPDMFSDGADVIVEGSYDSETNAFKAKTLLAKCPSKYESEKEENGEYAKQSETQ